MPATEADLRQPVPLRFTDIADPARVNAELLAAFQRENARDDVKRTHGFNGRFENIYIARDRIPELRPVIAAAMSAAQTMLGRSDLRFGCWFNEMQPGEGTSLHAHEELDELLSAVYYIVAPDNAGRLILHDDDCRICVTPRPGLLVLFPPDLPHEVEPNHSGRTRLSVAFNFGPLNSEI